MNLAYPREQNERLSMTLLRTDIEIALACLRLADAECRSGNRSRALELINKATRAYKAALEHLDNSPADLSEEARGLRQGARELFEAIRIAAFQSVASSESLGKAT